MGKISFEGVVALKRAGWSRRFEQYTVNFGKWEANLTTKLFRAKSNAIEKGHSILFYDKYQM